MFVKYCNANVRICFEKQGEIKIKILFSNKLFPKCQLLKNEKKKKRKKKYCKVRVGKVSLFKGLPLIFLGVDKL